MSREPDLFHVYLSFCASSCFSLLLKTGNLLDTEKSPETSNDSIIYYLEWNIFKTAYATIFRGLTNAAYLKPPAMMEKQQTFSLENKLNKNSMQSKYLIWKNQFTVGPWFKSFQEINLFSFFWHKKHKCGGSSLKTAFVQSQPRTHGHLKWIMSLTTATGSLLLVAARLNFFTWVFLSMAFAKSFRVGIGMF